MGTRRSTMTRRRRGGAPRTTRCNCHDPALYVRSKNFIGGSSEYIGAWKQATADNPVAFAGRSARTEQLPLVARLVNKPRPFPPARALLGGMDEWVMNGGKPPQHPLVRESTANCASTSAPNCEYADTNPTFLKPIRLLTPELGRGVRCVVQGGQGDISTGPNDPPKRAGYKDAARPRGSIAPCRMVDLHRSPLRRTRA
jgi:hypothetical protein